MTPDQVVDVLTKCAAYDQRTVGEGDVMAWWEILGRADLADALEAVRVYYTEQSDRAMPADIRKLALNIRDQRQARERQAERRLAIEAGTQDRSEDVKALVASVVEALPQADIHQRAVDRARKERGRPERKPHKERRKKSKVKLPKPQSDEVATLARRYIVDGWEPDVVSERFGIDLDWCRKLARRPDTVAAREKAEKALRDLARQRAGEGASLPEES